MSPVNNRVCVEFIEMRFYVSSRKSGNKRPRIYLFYQKTGCQESLFLTRRQAHKTCRTLLNYSNAPFTVVHFFHDSL